MVIDIDSVNVLIHENNRSKSKLIKQYPLTDRLTMCLISRLNIHLDLNSKIDYLYNYKFSGICGNCINRQGKEPYCPCMMLYLTELYKYDLILILLTTSNV